MSGVVNWTEGGILPLQDHDSDHSVGRRLLMAGARIAKQTDLKDASSGEDAELILAAEDGFPTVGDVHPWLFWQSAHGKVEPPNPRIPEGERDRPMGMWAQSYIGVVSTSRTGTGVGASLRALPIYDGRFDADTRFKELPVRVPSCFGQPPRGSLVLIQPGTKEDEQTALAVPIDKRLYAPHVHGPAGAGTQISDFQPSNRVLPERTARLQSAVRVIALRDGSLGRVTTRFNGLALNFASSEQEGSPGYGMIYGPMTPAGTSGGNPQSPIVLDDTVPSVCGTTGEFGPRRRRAHGVAFLERSFSGPITCGHESDQHRIGRDADGHAINAAHITTNAYFYRNRREDGPLLFEGDWPGAQRFPLRSFVHLTWDGALQHPFVRGARSGKWRWWAEVPYFSPDGPKTPGPSTPPPGPRTPGPSTPGTPGPTTPAPTGPTTGGGQPGGGQPGGGTTGGGGGGQRGPTTIPRTPTNPPPTGPTTPAPTGPTTGGRGNPGEPQDPPIWEDPPPQRQYEVPPFGGRDPLPGGGGGGGDSGGGGAPREGDPPPGPWLDPETLGYLDDPSPREGATPLGPDEFEFKRADAIVRVGDPLEDPEYGEYEIFHPFAEGFAGIAFRPQLNLTGARSFLRNPEVDPAEVEADERERPTTLKVHSWGAHRPEFERWDYATEPEDARTRGGIVHGGILFAPPEHEIEDYLLDGVDTAGVARSAVMLAPGVDLAWGEPVADRTVMSKRSVFAARDMTQEVRPLVISQVDDAGDDVPLLSIGATVASEPQVVALGAAGFVLPRGDNASRMSAPAPGTIRVSSEDAGGDVVEYFDGGTSSWVSLGTGGGGGETNTLASPTAAASLVLPKTGEQLNIRGIASANSRLTATEDGDDVSLAVVEGNIVLANLSGTATNAQYPNAVLRDGTRAMTAALDAGGFALVNVASPTDLSDAANKQYVDDEIAALPPPGETNTLASPTVNTSLVLAKTGEQLNIRGLTSGNNRLAIALDGTDDVSFTVEEANIILANLSGAATDAQYPNAILRDGSRSMIGNFDAGEFQIKNLAAPSLSTDAVDLGTMETNIAEGDTNTLNSANAHTDSELLHFARVVDVNNSEATAVNTTVWQTAYSYTVAANALGANGYIDVHVYGNILVNDTAGNPRVRLLWGGTAFYVDIIGWGAGTSTTRAVWVLKLRIANLGSTSTQWATAVWQCSINGGAVTGVGNMDQPFGESGGAIGPAPLTSKDTTSAQTVEMQFGWTGGSVDQEWKKLHATTSLCTAGA